MKTENQKLFYYMILNLLLVLALNLLTGCGQQSLETESQGIPKGFTYEVRASDLAQPRGRFYFIHGMGQVIKDLKQGEWGRMGDTMHNEGFEVVYIQWGWLDASDMTNNGADHVQRFTQWIGALDTQLSSERPVVQTFIGGASMGGYHSILASQVIQADAIYASQTVTRLSVLWPFAGANTTGADLFSQPIPNNLFVTAGTADVTIHWEYTRELFGNSPNYREYPGHTHGPYVDEYDDLIAWFRSRMI